MGVIISKNARSPQTQAVVEERRRSVLRKLRLFLERLLPRRKKVRGDGKLLNISDWTEEDLHKIIHKIGKKCPGVLSISVYKNEISFSFECTPEEFLGKKKKKTRELENPSKREISRKGYLK